MDIKNDVRISVIVPSYNEEKMIGRCLRAIRAQKFRDYELIVVDGHSTDNTMKIAKKYADIVLLDSGVGAGAARNLAARRAKGEILAFTDADTIVCRNWLARIDDDFRRYKKIAGLGGPYLFISKNKTNVALMKLCYKIAAAVSKKVPPFAGNNCAYSRDAFMKSGGFRKDMHMLDDFELSMRMKKLGGLKFDKTLLVKTSMRRLRQKGYLAPISKFILAYLALFFGLNIKVGKNYLREIRR